MGIYIKGLKDPANCCKCRFSRWSNYGQLYMCDVCEKPVAEFQSEYESTKPDWCPLVEVHEPHGRLIDADAFKKTLDYYICEANWGDEVNKALRWVKDEFINSEDTVIEAEGSED